MDADFDIRYTDRPIMPFGGLTTVKNFYQNSGLQDVISSLPLPMPGSNRGYDPVDIIEGFLVSVILGARRLAHAGLLRHDKVVSEMFGYSLEDACIKIEAWRQEYNSFRPHSSLEGMMPEQIEERCMLEA